MHKSYLKLARAGEQTRNLLVNFLSYSSLPSFNAPSNLQFLVHYSNSVLTLIFSLVNIESVYSNESSCDVFRPDPVVSFRPGGIRHRPFGDDLHHVGLVDPVHHRVPEFCHHFENLRLEGVQGKGSNLGHVHPETPVDPGAVDAERDAEIDGSPLRVGGAAVAAFVVA